MKSITSILAVLALGTTVAFAAEEKKPAAAADKPAAAAGDKADKPKRNPEEAFKKLDANSDGKVSAEEFEAGPAGKKDPAKAKEAFAKKDKDGDKALSLDEFKGGGKKKDK